jgi:carboxylate-amine ligase
MLLDPDGWRLDHDFAALHERLSDELAERLSAETHGAAAEYSSAPHPDPTDAAAEIVAMRHRLAAEVREHGLAVAASGTHPFVTWEETEVADAPRSRVVHQTMRELARREPTFAMHVHVAVPDPDQAVAAANRMRAHLPILLALSANSPFWQGRDTGMASARTPIFQAFPRSGMPRAFADYRDYVETIETLIECGAFPEPTFVWWDLRLQPTFGTIEVRIMDVQSDAERNAPLAALVQALVRLEALEGHAVPELVEAPEILEENRFLAARDGAGAELVDPVARRRVPVAGLLDGLLAACLPHARELGTEAELGRVWELVERPADRVQRELAGPYSELTGLVAELSRRFATDRPPPAGAASDRRPEHSVAPQRSR